MSPPRRGGVARSAGVVISAPKPATTPPAVGRRPSLSKEGKKKVVILRRISRCLFLRRAAAVAGVRQIEQELLHVPGAGRAAIGAQPAVQAHVLVLRHYPAGLERARD